MKWKWFLLSVPCIIGLTAVVNYTVYDYSGPLERLSHTNEHVEDQSGSRPTSGPRIKEETVQAQGRIEPEKETVPSAASELVEWMLENGSDTGQSPAVPPHPEAPVPMSDEEPKITPEASLAGLSEKDRDSVENTEPPPDALSESTEAEGSRLAVTETESMGEDPTTVRRSTIALVVEGREPKGIGERVSVDQGRVYCWVHVIGGAGRTITVRWIANGKRLWDTHLAIGSNDWRTWAYMTLRPSVKGPAQALILNEEGKVLKAHSFEITG